MGRSLESAKILRFDPDIAYTADSPLSRMQKELFVRDYGAIGDGTFRTVEEWLPGGSMPRFPTLTALQVVYPHVTSPTDSLDWAAIQKAVKTGRNVGFHDGRYMLGNNQILSTTVAQAFYGLNSNFSANLGDPASKGAIIMWSPVTSSQPAWIAQNSHQRFTGLKFWGPGNQADSIAVMGQKLANTDDMDIAFVQCEFYMVAQPIYSYGRGLLVDDCLFSQINAGYAITNDWPTTGTTGGEAQTDDRYKGRALRVTNNRLHGTGTLVRIHNFVARSPLLADNMLDLGNRLILIEATNATTGVRYANLTGNVADACGLTPIEFKVGTICDGLAITGGSLGGSIDATIDGAAKRPFNIIAMDGCSMIDGLSISNVDLHGCAANVIGLSNDAGATAITPKNISIKGGRISAYGQSGAARAVVSSVYDIDGLTIDPGAISDIGPSVGAIVRTVGTKTVSNLALGPACSRVAVPTFLTMNVAGNVDGIERLTTGRYKRYLGRWNLWEQEVTATPEASLAGYKGCRAINLATGDQYSFKGTDTQTTGWVAL